MAIFNKLFIHESEAPTIGQIAALLLDAAGIRKIISIEPLPPEQRIRGYEFVFEFAWKDEDELMEDWTAHRTLSFFRDIEDHVPGERFCCLLMGSDWQSEKVLLALAPYLGGSFFNGLSETEKKFSRSGSLEKLWEEMKSATA